MKLYEGSVYFERQISLIRTAKGRMIKMFKKKDNRPKTQKIILKEFPIISITDVENIDYNIKSRTSLKTIPLTNKDYSKVVRE